MERQLHETFVGEFFHKVIIDWDAFINHVNKKRILSAEFENDKHSETMSILRIDFAMNYSCEYQNEVQSALWSCNSVFLFTAVTVCDGTCKTSLIRSDSKQKNKDTIGVFLFHLYDQHISPTESIDSEVIWSDNPSSKFKNRYNMHLMKILSIRHKTHFPGNILLLPMERK